MGRRVSGGFRGLFRSAVTTGHHTSRSLNPQLFKLTHRPSYEERRVHRLPNPTPASLRPQNRFPRSILQAKQVSRISILGPHPSCLIPERAVAERESIGQFPAPAPPRLQKLSRIVVARRTGHKMCRISGSDTYPSCFITKSAAAERERIGPFSAAAPSRLQQLPRIVVAGKARSCAAHLTSIALHARSPEPEVLRSRGYHSLQDGGPPAELALGGVNPPG